MKTRESAAADPLLAAFFEAGDGEAEHVLAGLMAVETAPLVERILRSLVYSREARLAGETWQDVRGQVLVRILGRLRALRSDPRAESIADFPRYVAVTTYRTYYEHLRAQYPERHRLKNRLRYVLTHHPALALWSEADGTWRAGLAAWRGGRKGEAAPAGPPGPRIEGVSFRTAPGEFLVRLFRAGDGPLAFDDLVEAVAEREGVRRPLRVPPAPDGSDALTSPGDPVAQAHDRIFLRQLWPEIRRLPLLQRRVLLLNLSDGQGRDLIALLPLVGVATLPEIAEALEMPAEELARLWGDLPLDDATLAATMNLTRQQVINLRVSARRRLARRMRPELARAAAEPRVS
jgi:hypothetical protein